MIKKYLLVLACIAAYASNAQTTTETSKEPTTVVEQFDAVLKSSGNYNGNGKRYKVIERYKLDAFRKAVNDSVLALKSQIQTLDELIANQNAEITGLKTNLEATNDTLESTRAEKDSMSLFGIQMSKAGYNMTVWGIAGALLLGLVFFISKFKSSNSITQEARRKLEETEKEFDAYRKKALEKEQKMGRMLQDERNKQSKAAKS